MLDTLRARVAAALEKIDSVMLATDGPAGLQVSQCPCHSREVSLFLLLPQTSEHLVNLEWRGQAIASTPAWQMRGLACRSEESVVRLFPRAETQWYVVVEMQPLRFDFVRPNGAGASETIDFEPPTNRAGKEE
ncbi:MAG: hypothetical protein JNJ61_28570 [Anaerolineae bacterium]|nr:hypothetical protein [Anaerolineae bacterium]